jgi:hypothetical protein
MHLEQTNPSIASKVNSIIPTSCQYPKEKAISEKLGLAIRVGLLFEFVDEQLTLKRIKGGFEFLETSVIQ